MEQRFVQDILKGAVRILQALQAEDDGKFHSASHKFILKNAVCILNELGKTDLPDAGYIREKASKILEELESPWLWRKPDQE